MHISCISRLGWQNASAPWHVATSLPAPSPSATGTSRLTACRSVTPQASAYLTLVRAAHVRTACSTLLLAWRPAQHPHSPRMCKRRAATVGQSGPPPHAEVEHATASRDINVTACLTQLRVAAPPSTLQQLGGTLLWAWRLALHPHGCLSCERNASHEERGGDKDDCLL